MVSRVLFCCLFTWVSVGAIAHSQTVEGDILRGQGAFLRGAGAFNLNTAKANAINVDAMIRWKADLRKIQQERRELELQKKYEKNMNIEQVRSQMARREQELRSNPSPEDVQSGAALNALVYDLTDPDLTSNRWKSVSPVRLPERASVKEMIFSFTPHRTTTQSSAALSRGVIALSRLDIKDKWPPLLKKDELSNERKAYEAAYLRVQEKMLKGAYPVDEVLALHSALANLRAKIVAEIPAELGYQAEAIKFVVDLHDATRMFDAKSIDYAREILLDTKDHDATTVEELVAFMTKYRLQFANSERSPKASALYGEIYQKLREQASALNVKYVAPAPGPSWTSLFNGKDLAGWTIESGTADRWKVERGTIVARGDESVGYLLSQREYSNFILRLDVSLDKRVASGVALRAIRDEKMWAPPMKAGASNTPRHPVVVIADSDARPATGALRWLADPTKIAVAPEIKPTVLPAGSWNHLEIQVRDRSIRVILNDKQIVDATIPVSAQFPDGTLPGLSRTKGRIGLQSLGGTARFRNIEIMELTWTK